MPVPHLVAVRSANVREKAVIESALGFAEANVHADARRPVNNGIARGIPFTIQIALTR